MCLYPSRQSTVVCPPLSLLTPAPTLITVCNTVDARIILKCDAWADVLKHR